MSYTTLPPTMVMSGLISLISPVTFVPCPMANCPSTRTGKITTASTGSLGFAELLSMVVFDLYGNGDYPRVAALSVLMVRSGARILRTRR